jgi:hypothetical protein
VIDIIDSVVIARDLLLNNSSDVEHWPSIEGNVQDIARELESLARFAPTRTDESQLQQTAAALRELTYAVQAAQLLQVAPVPPSAEQLGAADNAVNVRLRNLNSAIDRMSAYVAEASI